MARKRYSAEQIIRMLRTAEVELAKGEKIDATRALMLKFYELWDREGSKGLDAVAALRQAQAFVKSHEKWAHPYYWSAWVLWGLPE